MRIKLLFVSMLLLFLNFSVEGQRYNFNYYSITDAYDNAQITSVIQDRRGPLWVGTLGGVLEFDGKRFQSRDRELGFENTPIQSLFQDSNNNIWFGSIRKGIYKWDGLKIQSIPLLNLQTSTTINGFAETDSKIWVATSTGLIKIEKGKLVNINSSNGLKENNIIDIKSDLNGNIWFASHNYVGKFDGKKYYFFENKNPRIKEINTTIYPHPNGQVYVGSTSGVYIIYPNDSVARIDNELIQGRRVTRIQSDPAGNIWCFTFGSGVFMIKSSSTLHFTQNNGLQSNIIQDGIIDSEGNVWMASPTALIRFGGDMFVTYTMEHGLSSNNILASYTSADSSVWFGTLGGGLINIKDNDIKLYDAISGFVAANVWSVHEGKSGKLYAGTNDGILSLDTKRDVFRPLPISLKGNVVYTILEDPDGSIWAGTDRGIFHINGNKITKLNSGETRYSENIRVLFLDSRSRIWVGTIKGLYYIQEGKIIPYLRSSTFSEANITSILEDKNGSIIIGTYDSGILIIKKNKGASDVISQINAINGLYQDNVLSLSMDNFENLWVGTSSDLESIDWKTYYDSGRINVKKYDRSKGYHGTECNSITIGKNNTLWLGTVNGIIETHPEKKPTPNNLPKTIIKGINLFLNEVNWVERGFSLDPFSGLPDNLSLKYNDNYLSFNYNAVFLSSPGDIRYQYRLDGHENNWSQPTSASSVAYAKLPAGEYTFMVKARVVNSENWSVPATFSFKILKPIWLTPVFIIAYIIILITLIFAYIRLRTYRLQQNQKVLSKRVDERTRQLNLKNQELEKLSIVAQETDNAVLIFDKDQDLEWVNEGFTRLTGYSIQEMFEKYGKTLTTLSFNLDIDKHMQQAISSKSSVIFEALISRKDGREICIQSTLTPIFNKDQTLKKIVVINTDISTHKALEDTIKKSLEEQQKLLREIHHRVKNNLQIIISLLNLQASYVYDEEALKALKEGQDRVKSLALIHEKIYQSDELTDLDFQSYIRKLVDHLMLSYNIRQGVITLDVHADDIILDIDTAVPSGLIITELVSNSLKYAFVGREKGAISISLKEEDDRMLRLTVSDNGIGLPENFDVYQSDSLGMQLVTALTDQLEGRIELDRKNGISFQIIFQRVPNIH